MGSDFNDQDAYTLKHSQLGKLIGTVKHNPQVVQFYSIPYASIPERFRQSEILTKIPASHSKKFTEIGPLVPQVLPPHNRVVYGTEWECDDSFICDEFNSLSLTISVSKNKLNSLSSSTTLLPVLFYIHGGGFYKGSAVYGREDNSFLASYSEKIKKPILVVSIQYRCGAFGFLASKALLNEAERNNETALNYGLFDQLNALKWVQKFISGFGGDPNNVTIAGESAGAVSCFDQAISPLSRGLFKRVAFFSGHLRTLPPLSIEVLEKILYKPILKAVGIDFDNTTEAEQIKRLRTIPAEELVKAYSSNVLFFYPCLSGGFFPNIQHSTNKNNIENELLVKNPDITDIASGCTSNEGAYFNFHSKFSSVEKFVSIFTKIATMAQVPKDVIDKLLKVAGIDQGSKFDEKKAINGVSQLLGEFFISAHQYKLDSDLVNLLGSSSNSGSNKKRYYRYSFERTNPFDGPMKGFSHHTLDLLYFFLSNTTGPMSGEYDTKLANDYASGWIKFVYGEEAWPEFISTGKIFSITDDKGAIIIPYEEDKKIYKNIYEMRDIIMNEIGDLRATKIFDTLSGAA